MDIRVDVSNPFMEFDGPWLVYLTLIKQISAVCKQPTTSTRLVMGTGEV